MCASWPLRTSFFTLSSIPARGLSDGLFPIILDSLTNGTRSPCQTRCLLLKTHMMALSTPTRTIMFHPLMRWLLGSSLSQTVNVSVLGSNSPTEPKRGKVIMVLATTTFVKTQHNKTMIGRIICGEQRVSEFNKAKSILTSSKSRKVLFQRNMTLSQ